MTARHGLASNAVVSREIISILPTNSCFLERSRECRLLWGEKRLQMRLDMDAKELNTKNLEHVTCFQTHLPHDSSTFSTQGQVTE